MSEETKGMPKVPSEMEAPKALNYIEKLVAKLCPDGVEYVKVGDIADIGTGSSDRKDRCSRLENIHFMYALGRFFGPCPLIYLMKSPL